MLRMHHLAGHHDPGMIHPDRSLLISDGPDCPSFDPMVAAAASTGPGLPAHLVECLAIARELGWRRTVERCLQRKYPLLRFQDRLRPREPHIPEVARRRAR